jgi:hypothetical protein
MHQDYKRRFAAVTWLKVFAPNGVIFFEPRWVSSGKANKIAAVPARILNMLELQIGLA